jgi:hypothetical protein
MVRIRQLVLVDEDGQMICHASVLASSETSNDPLVEARQELFTLLLEQTGMKIIEVNKLVRGKTDG